MILPTFDYEKKYWDKGFKFVSGVDEAGRGPLAGPVAAGAVVVFPEQAENLKNAPEWKLIRDSKTLSAIQREKAYDFVTANFLFGVGLCGEETIDRINILQAAFLAMKKALTDLKNKSKKDVEIVLIDGRSRLPSTSIRQENIVGGDQLAFSISAASIVAKVTRDRIMRDFHEKFPQYGFDKHKGYGTKMHFEMIEKYGLCEIHRKSFRTKK